MKALIMLLFNTAANTWHPIFYFESPLPSESVTRYKSKGHHTTGFATKEGALKDIELSLVSQIKSMGYTLTQETESFIQWDGTGVPADTQIR